jgi:transmembrane sensor
MIKLKKSGSHEASRHDVAMQAAYWAHRTTADPLTPAEATAFDAWLGANACHVQALSDAKNALDALAAFGSSSAIVAMRNEALERRAVRTHSMVLGGRGLIAASLILVALLGAERWRSFIPSDANPIAHEASLSSEASYRTERGQLMTIALPDGSTVTLDTASQLRIAFNSHERAVELVHGQALFEVAKHQSRPFRVYAGGHRVTAVGTKFNVRLDRRRMSVALLDGVVQVDNTSGKLSSSIRMAPGEQLDALDDGPTSLRHIDATYVAAWRDGALTFEDLPLGAAVAEMNRYSQTPIQLEGDVSEKLRVTGVFKTNDPEHFAAVLTEILPLNASHGKDGAISLRPRP